VTREPQDIDALISRHHMLAAAQFPPARDARAIPSRAMAAAGDQGTIAAASFWAGYAQGAAEVLRILGITQRPTATCDGEES